MFLPTDFLTANRSSLRVTQPTKLPVRERRAQKTALLDFRAGETHRALNELTRLALSLTHLELPAAIAALSRDKSYHQELAEISEDRHRVDQLPRGVPLPKDEGIL